MNRIIAPKWNLLSVGAFLSFTFASAFIAKTPSHKHIAAELPRVHIETQIVHATELLSRAPQSLVQAKKSEKTVGAEFIYRLLESKLPYDYRWQAGIIAHVLIDESNRYSLDPFFLLAVIQTESDFNPKARGHSGDMGLMQLLPSTGKWVGKRLNLPNVDLYDPATNIRVGAAYIADLRKHFSRVGSRYLAAYNMGIGNVHKLLDQDVEPVRYARRVLKNYQALYEQFAASLPEKRTMVTSNN